jgi:hypothetical protein
VSVQPDSPRPPDDARVRARHIPFRYVQWARECDEIMVEYGSVEGSIHYPKRQRARWRAKYLIRLLVDLRIHDRDELLEHTDEMPDGQWSWTVELRRSDEPR